MTMTNVHNKNKCWVFVTWGRRKSPGRKGTLKVTRTSETPWPHYVPTSSCPNSKLHIFFPTLGRNNDETIILVLISWLGVESPWPRLFQTPGSVLMSLAPPKQEILHIVLNESCSHRVIHNHTHDTWTFRRI